MSYLLTSLLSSLLVYKYVAISLVVFLAGLLVPLPSNTLLLAAGAFASQGYLNAPAVFLIALVSNVFGDSLGYSLTRFWGTRIITKARLDRFAAVEKIEQFVNRHVRLTILATRFIGTPGVIVNFLCGLAGVPYRRFLLYDVIGNALDTALFLVIGYILGVYSESYSYIADLVGGIVLVAALIYLIFKLFLRKDASASETRP